jgi:hypothetical protein
MIGIATNDLCDVEGITNPPLFTKLLNGVNPLKGCSTGLKVKNDSLIEIGSGSLSKELLSCESFTNEFLFCSEA